MTSKPLDYIDTWTTPVPPSLSLSLSLSLSRFNLPSVSTNLSLSSSCLAKPGLYGHPPVLNSLSVIEGVR